LLSAYGVRFYQVQNSGAFGGAISKAKAFWLPFAIFFWFVLCALVAADERVEVSWRVVFGGVAALMWVRGPVELYMLYRTKNWKPPYGIAHDFLCVVWLAAAAAFAAASSVDAWLVALWALLVLSLVVEIHHAWSFYVAVKGHTVGDDGIWFADDDPRFIAINRRTLFFNVVIGFGVAVYVLHHLAVL
jgi:hypothetical protein